MTLAFSSFAGESKRAEAQAVDQACAQDAQTAGCGNAQVGTGLIKCIHAYKKEHKDFKVSEGCRDSFKKLKEAKRERREEKQEEKKSEAKK